MMPLPGFQNPTPYLAPAVAKNSYTSLFKSYAKKNQKYSAFLISWTLISQIPYTCFELEVPNSIYSTAKPHTPGREKCQMCNGSSI